MVLIEMILVKMYAIVMLNVKNVQLKMKIYVNHAERVIIQYMLKI